MTVTVTREAESQLELYGAYEGEVLGGALPRTWLTFTATADYLIIAPKNNPTYAQLEAGSVPSSYIPTAGSTATRAAETLTVPAANLPYSATAMSIHMAGRMTYADNSNAIEARFFWWRADASNYIFADYATDGIYDRMKFQQGAGGVFDNKQSTSAPYSPGIAVPFNFASRHGSTFVNGAVDGTALTADLTPTALPDLSATDLTLGSTFNGYIDQFAVWSDDIGDTGIAEVST